MSRSRQATRANARSNEGRCQNCGSFVTPEFARVFGNNDHEVFGCLDCMSATDVKNGNASTETGGTSTTVTNRGTVR